MSKPLAAIGALALAVVFLSVGSPATAAPLTANAALPTSTTASVAPRPAQYLAPITFTADVTTEVRSASGTVDFLIDGTKRYASELQYTNDAADDSVATAIYSPDFDSDGLVLEPGEHTLVAVYGGDEAFATSSATTTFSVVDAQSTTLIESSMNPAPEASPVTYDVTTAVPDGSDPLAGYDIALTFANGAGTTVVHGTLDEHGAYRTEPLTVTRNTEVTALITGDGPVAGSSAGLFQYVIGAGDLVALTAKSSLNPAPPGEPIELTADLTPPDGSPAPTGTVSFTDGSTLLCESNVTDSTATCTGANPAGVGGHRIVATYSGDGTYRDSYGLVYQQTIPGATETAIAVEPTENPVFGQPVSFTADVATVTGSGGLSGTVTFTINGEPFGDRVPVNADGTASSATISSLSVGSHHIVATYSGDVNMQASTGELDIVILAVGQAATATVVTSSANPSITGQEVHFTARVTARPSGSPTGTVQFEIDGLALGAPVPVVQGAATSDGVSDLPPDSGYDVVAVYSGDADFAGSSGAMTQWVGADRLAMTVTSSLNPSVFGEGVSFTANVTAAALVPPGQVQFSIDGEPFGAEVPVTDGIAISPEIFTVGAGEHRVSAEFLADVPSANTSGTLIQTVSAAATSAELSSSSAPAVFGAPVTFTADVSSTTTATPDGAVQFLVDGAPLGSPVALENGRADSSAVNDLSVAGHIISVVYEGNDQFGPSSDELTQSVVQAPTTTTLTASANPSSPEDSVVFTASVAATAPSEATPTGAVQFKVDGIDVGAPVAITDGSATSESVSALALGNHDVVAEYLGDTDFRASSDAITQSVATVDTEMTVTSSANPSKLGDTVAFSATVTELPSSISSTFIAFANGVASGTVQFDLDGVPYGAPIDTVDGVASISIADLSAGAHTIAATFTGSGFTSSTASMTQQVDEVPTPPVSPPAPPSGAGGSTLPATGSDFAPPLGIGLSLILLALGAVCYVLVVTRRRRQQT